MYKKSIAIFALILLTSNTYLFPQVTIGSTVKPIEGAILDLKQNEGIVDNSNKGLMLPRVELEDKMSLYPMFSKEVYTLDKTEIDKRHKGLLVFNINEKVDDLCKGLYIWNGLEWSPLAEPTKEWILDKDRSDEFKTLDFSKWRTDLWFTTSGSFAFNSQNVSIENDNLVIKAKKESFNGKGYTSGALRSVFHIEGNTRVEIRAKLPDYRANVTSALWLSRKPELAISPSLEIDLMETFLNNNNNNRFTSGLHYWWYGGNPPSWVSNISGSDQNLGWFNFFTDNPLSDAYHIWAIERTNNKIEFFFDEILYWSHDITQVGVGTGHRENFIPEDYRSNFNKQPIDIIFNIEGHAGSPVEEYLPAKLLVDYVKVYERKCSLK